MDNAPIHTSVEAGKMITNGEYERVYLAPHSPQLYSQSNSGLLLKIKLNAVSLGQRGLDQNV